MQRGLLGRYAKISTVGGEQCEAFIPKPLPPEPPLRIEGALATLLEEATLAVGRLDGMTSMLPETSLFLYSYVRKEAVLSSQIEGTQSSLSDLLLFENDLAPGVPLDDAREVSNYVAAMKAGLDRLGKLPISLRLLREIHGILLGSGRGLNQSPGEFRRTQNWIGGSRPGNATFVPPPPDQLLACLGDLENFLHDQQGRTPLLIKAGLAHLQFETIHPFLDGNGRLGRLLITLLLCAGGALREPLLYLSLYLKQHRSEYYRLLQQTRLTGDWEGWLEFFMTGVRDTAGQAVETAHGLLALFDRDRARLASLGRAADSALRVQEALRRRPIMTAGDITMATGLAAATASKALENLIRLGIAREVTGKSYGRLFAYSGYVDVLSEGTEPL